MVDSHVCGDEGTKKDREKFKGKLYHLKLVRN